ncbi:sugar ABC transporter ATP-binding protein [Crateriforma conspicua]|uniref:Galactose/methyl galactoside import ATP-binding protein MglA n=1 Tax=Crateriforma conspicua TaxID=2527996 RepID=A0A5C5Y3C5_9PLAN|nr:sugar ABC transporter ATP-binding protein [Crateriforma conspicua]QDV63946.1 Galactose/methyl galactoside import ATP-binding protein MglA [Crateriforma conspicua]TWT69309.1 Galactose/methyl galactoside import ATP-binding protein MglA [Crateriforma conspicua]
MPDQPTSNELLRIEGISKTFPGVRALDEVDLSIRPGEIHALMGENGAGKSTLIKVLTGVHSRDSGQIWFDGQTIAPHSPSDAERLGISTVYQEVNLIPHLSVAENIMLGRQPTRFGLLSWKQIRRRAANAVRRIGLDVKVQRELADCSIAVQQLVALARAVDVQAKLLILDEPTSSLDEREVDELFVVLQRLKDEGIAIIFVTHFLDQVYRLADRITVLRNGRHVGTYPTGELPRLQLVAKMLGRDPDEIVDTQMPRARPDDAKADTSAGADTPLLSAMGLAGQNTVQPFDLELHPGRVTGLAGLLGSGRTEVIRLLFGLDRPGEGTLSIDGETVDHPSPRKMIRRGLAFCPEDRKRDGVFLDLSVRQNIVVALQARAGAWRTLSLAKQNALAEHYIERLGIKTPSPETPVGNLSGGNQQKVLLARWLAMQPKLILLDEPTRGIDVGAKAEIESLVESLRRDGMSVVFVSSELDEVVRTCQEVAVMRDRRLIDMLDGDDLNESNIMQRIAHHDDA